MSDYDDDVPFILRDELLGTLYLPRLGAGATPDSIFWQRPWLCLESAREMVVISRGKNVWIV
jgi:hypothetical protein